MNSRVLFQTKDGGTSLSMEVLMRSSRPSCSMELMLKTILLWLWLSDEVPNRDHLDLPVRVRSHITISPLEINTWIDSKQEECMSTCQDADVFYNVKGCPMTKRLLVQISLHLSLPLCSWARHFTLIHPRSNSSSSALHRSHNPLVYECVSSHKSLYFFSFLKESFLQGWKWTRRF